jgi:hypothetical protein
LGNSLEAFHQPGKNVLRGTLFLHGLYREPTALDPFGYHPYHLMVRYQVGIVNLVMKGPRMGSIIVILAKQEGE